MVKLIIKLLEKTLNYLRKLENKDAGENKLENGLRVLHSLENIYQIKESFVEDIKKEDEQPSIPVKKTEPKKVKKKKDLNKERKIKLKQKLFSAKTISQIFRGQDVFIIGTGSSLIDFDFNLLKGKNTIAINKSFERVIDPSVCIGLTEISITGIKRK